MLNLWQKNGVFKIEIIQPLLDMAAGSSNAVPGAESVTNNEGKAKCVYELENGMALSIHEMFGVCLYLWNFFHEKETS